MWQDRVSNLGPLALESDALPTALRGPSDTDPQAKFSILEEKTKVLFSRNLNVEFAFSEIC